MFKALKTVGRYIILMGRVFARPERMRMFFRQYVNELEQLGVNSIGIVLLISFFIGAVITIQIKLNIESPFMPRWTVGYVTREIMLLEFSSSIMCLILAGKVGSNIASELGTMRVTQQIDALEIMGVNSANYLILPKIAAMVHNHSTDGDVQYIRRYHRCLLYLLVRRHHVGGRFRIRLAVHVCRMVYLVRHHQVAVLCLYHCQRIGILRLHRRRRFHRSGQGVHRLRSMQQRAYLIRRPNINSTFNGMIELKGLCKSFEDREVLKDINATFENGKTNLIIGQSGSGKTVLMKCIVGLLTPDKGELLYDHRNFLAMGKKEKKALRREMGMIFQSAALFDSMTVLDNVMFPLNMFSNDTLRDRTRRAMFCLERVNLIEAKDKFPGEISGGMQKRVAIARAIALNPQYLFCDEPNSGLDPKTSLVIDELIQDITREYNMTTLINTHDMNSVMGIGEKIIYIYEGHKEWEGNKDDIFTSTNERLNSFIFASDLFRKVKEVEIQNLEG